MRSVALLTLAAVLLAAAPAAAFETNGKKWEEMPIPYWINISRCPVLEDETTIVEVLEAATAEWMNVACADITFQYMGTTDAEWAADGQNTIYCVDAVEDWAFGEGAAGATLWIPTDEGEPMEVDLALNAAELEWLVGGGDALTDKVVDPQALVTHELGHWLGLAHTPKQFATMYYATLPGGIQKTLDGDDKAGVCSIYPNDIDECATDEDCGDDFRCVTIKGYPVCEELHDPPGAFCNKDYIDCDQMCWVSFYECEQLCLFTDLAYEEGYCAPLCDPDSKPCPDGFDCIYIADHDIHICYIPDQPADGPVERPPEASPEPAVEAPASPEPFEVLDPIDTVPSVDTVTPVDAIQPVADTKDEGGDSGGGGCAAGVATGPWWVLLLMGLGLLRRRKSS